MIGHRRAPSFVVAVLVVAFVMVAAGWLGAETYPVRLRNVSGLSVDFALGDGPVFTGTSWVVLGDWHTTVLHVKPEQYLFYRYHGRTTGWRHFQLGKQAGNNPSWRFTSGSYYFPTLQKDPANVININGAWKMGGPYNVGMPCKIIQKGTVLTFINENGNKARGYYKDANTVIAIEWNNLYGDITADGKRINWRNKTWWIR
ncbi:MAG: hypothetical protein AB1714_20630 [Acidobacteriota bacterium]